MSKRAATDTSPSSQPSSVTGEAPIHTPASTLSETPHRGRGNSVSISNLRDIQANGKMDDKPKEQAASTEQSQEQEQPAAVTDEQEQQDEAKKPKQAKKKGACHKSSHKKQKAVNKAGDKKARKDAGSEDSSDADSDTSSDSDSGSSSEDERSKRKSKKAKKAKKTSKDKKRKSIPEEEKESEDESADDSSSEEEPKKKKKSKKAKSAKKASKDKKKRKSKKQEEDSEADESDSSDSEDSSEDEAPKRKKKSAKKSKQPPVSSDNDSDSSDEDGGSEGVGELQTQIDALKLKMAEKHKKPARSSKRRRSGEKSVKGKRKSSKKGDSPDYKRVDQLWDSTIHNYKLKESAEDDETEFAEYAFLVRRCFNWENKYTDTVVDIKSKQLRAVLAEVMKDCKSVSLEAEEPTIDPNILFLYLEELRAHCKKTLKAKIKAEKKRKVIKKLEQQKKLCKALVSYIDEDYTDTKKTLYPLLEAGNITFDLMWALFKPNEIAITSCYGSWDEPRCFKVDYATKCQTMQRGEWYCIEGKYLEYDGKGFGFGDFEVDVDGFKGPRKITNLATYPLKYHKDSAGIKKKIIERGQQFVGMEGMQYKFHKGLAFMKKKKLVAKININGRIMIDPATFRRINPNYPISFIKPKDSEDLFSDSDDDSDDCSCCAGDSDDEQAAGNQEDLQNEDHSEDKPKFKYKWSTNDEGDPVYVAVEVDENGDPIRSQRIDQLSGSADLRNKKYTEEELLLTSPVVLGFAFSEKLWLEFSLSGEFILQLPLCLKRLLTRV